MMVSGFEFRINFFSHFLSLESFAKLQLFHLFLFECLLKEEIDILKQSVVCMFVNEYLIWPCVRVLSACS